MNSKRRVTVCCHASGAASVRQCRAKGLLTIRMDAPSGRATLCRRSANHLYGGSAVKHKIILYALGAVLLNTTTNADAGLGNLWKRQTQCGDCCPPGDCCATECCNTRCVAECKSVTVTKDCWQTECEQVCIPPVTLPCCKCLFGKGSGSGGCGACGQSGCGGCGSGGAPGRPPECCRQSILQRIFGKCAGCRTRCINTLKKHEYDCEETVVEWKCVNGGSCGTESYCEPACSAPASCAPACSAPVGP